MPHQPSSFLKELGLFFVTLEYLIGFTGIGFGLGYFLYDRGWVPFWFIFLPGMLGLSYAFYQIYQRSKVFSNDEPTLPSSPSSSSLSLPSPSLPRSQAKPPSSDSPKQNEPREKRGTPEKNKSES